jgi:adenylylsulfate kinase
MAGARSNPPQGFVVWFEGLPGAGKTTVSRAVSEGLRARGASTEILDGEDVRRTFFPELGFSRKDRETHARRVSHLAQILARHGTVVLVAMITPYETSRQAARAVVEVPFVEVWLKCPLEVCEQRDPRGLYRRNRQGEVKRITGIDDPFEEPLSPELIVDSGASPVDACARRVLDYVVSKGLASPVGT